MRLCCKCSVDISGEHKNSPYCPWCRKEAVKANKRKWSRAHKEYHREYYKDWIKKLEKLESTTLAQIQRKT